MSRLLPLLALLVACGEAVPVNAPPPAAPKPPPKAASAEAPVAPEDQYYYNPAGKRDPFRGFLDKGKGDDDMPADAPPLQRYDVDKFTLKGVIWNTDSPRALLVDPEGLGHVVRIGNYVGRNWGKVTSIAEDGVIVTEEYQTLDGELVVNPVAVRFPAETKK